MDVIRFGRAVLLSGIWLGFLGGQRCGAQQPGGESYSFIDLSPAFNMGFSDSVAGDGKGGWTDQGPANDMAGFPVGQQSFGGVPFLIADPARNDGKSCVAFQGKPRPHFPLETPPLRVREKGQVIFFLGSCAWSASIGDEALRLVVTYTNDTRYSESAFVYGRDIGAWWGPSPLPLGRLAWEGVNHSSPVGLYLFAWINPYPDKEIDTIRLVSANTSAVPVIVGATLLKESADSSQIVAGLRRKEEALAARSRHVESADVKIDFSQPGVPIPGKLFSVGNGERLPLPAEFAAPARELFSRGPERPFFRYQLNRVEPSISKGVWDFSRLDAIVDQAVAEGAEVMLCIQAPPKWMYAKMSSYAESMKMRKPEDIGAFADYCAELVRYYNVTRKAQGKPPVVWWEIGNEMELYEWSYGYYIKVYREAARKMREVDVSIKLGGPVTAGPNYGWAKQLLMAAPDQVDFVSYHEYGYTEPFSTPNDYIMGRTGMFASCAKQYRQIMKEALPDRDLPLMLTEANTSWRYEEGTDPRIRTQFGAAWLASVLGHFLEGGGTSFCYFTLTGGFGMIWQEKGELKVYPAYYAMWLFRNFFSGNALAATSTEETVEAYGYRNDQSMGVFVINKNDSKVRVNLASSGGKEGAPVSYIVNGSTMPLMKEFKVGESPASESLLNEASAGDSAWAFDMEPYEVRALVWRK